MVAMDSLSGLCFCRLSVCPWGHLHKIPVALVLFEQSHPDRVYHSHSQHTHFRLRNNWWRHLLGKVCHAYWLLTHQSIRSPKRIKRMVEINFLKRKKKFHCKGWLLKLSHPRGRVGSLLAQMPVSPWKFFWRGTSYFHTLGLGLGTSECPQESTHAINLNAGYAPCSANLLHRRIKHTSFFLIACVHSLLTFL